MSEERAQYGDGGEAFPVAYGPDGTPGYGAGMTLRDYFAGQALTGVLASDIRVTHEMDIAKDAYLLADAMLQVRAAPAADREGE